MFVGVDRAEQVSGDAARLRRAVALQAGVSLAGELGGGDDGVEPARPAIRSFSRDAKSCCKSFAVPCKMAATVLSGAITATAGSCSMCKAAVVFPCGSSKTVLTSGCCATNRRTAPGCSPALIA